MGFLRQDLQIGAGADTVVGYVDNVAPSLANYETNPSLISDDLNNLRSAVNYARKPSFGGNWYDAQVAPSVLEAGALRGVDDLNDALHLVEKKRFYVEVHSLVDVTVGAGDAFVVLGTGELPPNTTASLGASNTLGTVIAAHGGTFGTHSLAVVAGPNALQPANLCIILDGATRDQIYSDDRVIYGLLQAESGVTDGGTITDTTTTRAQISFVRINATGDAFEIVPFADIENRVINYCVREQVRFEDVPKGAFLSGAIVDLPGTALVDRQTSYDNQGATPVELLTDATLDLAAGGTWEIRDVLNAPLFSAVEGSGGGTSQVNVHGDVDEFDVDAVVNDFLAGVTIRSGGTRPIRVGVSDGVVETSAGDLEVRGAGELFFDDGNQPGSWAQAQGIKLSEDSSEWTTFETNFGEVSILNAINQANIVVRKKVQATLTANVAADTDVNGPGTPHANTDVDLAPYDTVPNGFVDDVEVFVNGELWFNKLATGTANTVYPGGTPADGDLKFTAALKGTGTKPDRITVIVNGQA